MNPETPNHALQRTGAAVTLAAIYVRELAFRLTSTHFPTSPLRSMRQPRQPRRSLSLGSFAQLRIACLDTALLAGNTTV